MEDGQKWAQKKAHVLVLPYPSQGHISPMLQFSKRLASKGIKPTLVTTIHLSKSMHTTRPNNPPHPGLDIQTRTISDGFDEGGRAQAGSTATYLASLRAAGSKTLAELIRKLREEGEPVKAVIYDGFFPWALDVAKQFGILGVVFFTQSCAVNSVYYHVQRGLIQLPLLGPGPTTVSVPGVPELRPWEAPSFVSEYGLHPFWFDVVTQQFSNIDQADWVLCNIFYEMEKEVVDWMSKMWRVRTVGPTVPSYYLDKRLEDDKDYSLHIFKPNTAVCKAWLDTEPKGSVIYVSFGSASDPPKEQFEEMAWGLKATQHKFLWVVRDSHWAQLPQGFVDEVTNNGLGLVVGWASQLEVLAHEAIGCFVTHCGFNSVLEVLSIGVPVVAVPLWTDQGTNAKYLEDVWGVGIRAKFDEDGKGIATREKLAECVREVMKGERREEIVKNVGKWKKLAKEAIDQGGSSDKNIDEFVEFLKLC